MKNRSDKEQQQNEVTKGNDNQSIIASGIVVCTDPPEEFAF